MGFILFLLCTLPAEHHNLCSREQQYTLQLSDQETVTTADTFFLAMTSRVLTYEQNVSSGLNVFWAL